MNHEKKTLDELRGEIDRTDRELIRLLGERMNIAAEIAAFKRASGKAVYDPVREKAKLDSAAALAGEEFGGYTRRVFSALMEVSRDYQKKLLNAPSPLYEAVSRVRSHSPAFPQTAKTACQGTEGAYSFAAARKLFDDPEIVPCRTFGDVIRAVESGEARYGILPVENSTAGPVGDAWNLLEQRLGLRPGLRLGQQPNDLPDQASENLPERSSVYAVRAVRVRAEHHLLVNPGTKLADVREVVSHEQAIRQCGNFLAALPGVKITFAQNTAEAARFTAESGRSDLAAISSAECASLYGLEDAAAEIRNADFNETRFLCLSREPQITADADKTTVMLVTPNEPGALYRILSRFHALGINLTTLQSRPIEGRDFEFRFLIDFEASADSTEFAELMRTLPGECEEFRWLGTYRELR